MTARSCHRGRVASDRAATGSLQRFQVFDQAAQGGLFTGQCLTLFGGVPCVKALASLYSQMSVRHLLCKYRRRRLAALELGVQIFGNCVVDVQPVEVTLLQWTGDRKTDTQAPF